MSDINRVTIVGRLTRDPEVRHTSGGTAITSISLAVNTGRKDAAGKWVDVPNFVDVTLFGERFEKLFRMISKGTRIGIDGRLNYSAWETDGQKRSKLEVVGNEVQILDSIKPINEDDSTDNAINEFQAERVTADEIDF